jgi:hypothetical protein
MHTWSSLPVRSIALSLLLLACSHGEPFGPADHSTSDPFQPGIQPLRLTYGGGQSPAWLDSARIIYQFSLSDRENHPARLRDICLGVLPATAGTRLRSICSPSPFQADTQDLYQQPAPDGNRVAFVRSALSPVTGSGLSSIVLGALDSLPAGLIIGNDGFPGAHGQVMAIGLLRWLDQDEVTFLGSDEAIISPCDACDPIVVSRWRDAYRLNVAGGTTPQVIPGTEFATSIAVAPGVLFITKANDSRVLRLEPGSGASSVIATIASGATPRDADYANGRIVVVAGGKIEHFTDDNGDPAQGFDGGGELQLVDAATGAVTPLPSASLLFRRPRFSPDGASLVAEGYHYEILASGDTVVSPSADVYRVELP